MKTRIILETGCNHQGSIDIAKEMINLAARLKVWGVKFQKRDIESFSDELKRKPRSLDNSFGPTYYEHRAALEFMPWQLKQLKEHAESFGLVFLCSAFDSQSIDDLIMIGCEWIKLPSQLYTDEKLKHKLLTLQKTKDFKIIVSTGMHTYDEIFSNSWIDNADIIMACNSFYPMDDVDLECYYFGVINQLLKVRKEKPVGYSSHGEYGQEVLSSILCGAEYIERHFTLCQALKGSDHKTVSSTYDGIKYIKKRIMLAEKQLNRKKTLCKKEEAVKKIYRG